MILNKIRTIYSPGGNVIKHIYQVAKRYILGVYTANTAKFYYCDKNGKKTYPRPLNVVL